ncbi:hypothetical protein DXB06_03935 [Butyricicoccus sp. OF13-6]|nr:hypothetical protein DXB06_03935 [Butyricicoccus sp. OF13-6]
MQRKVCGQLLLAGQNRTVILFPAVEGECTVHAVLRAGHTGRNVCNGIAAANQHTLRSRCGITFRKITCYVIGKSKQLSMCSFQRNRTFKILYRFKDFIIYSGFISQCSVSHRCIDIQFTVFFAPAMSGICILKTVIIPIGNRKAVRGQNQAAAHFCCSWKIQLIATARINIIADGLRGIIVQGAVLCNLDGNILQSCNTAAITAAVVIGNCDTCCNIQDFFLKRIICKIDIFDIDCTTVYLCAIAGNAAAVQRNTAPVFAENCTATGIFSDIISDKTVVHDEPGAITNQIYAATAICCGESFRSIRGNLGFSAHGKRCSYMHILILVHRRTHTECSTNIRGVVVQLCIYDFTGAIIIPVNCPTGCHIDCTAAVASGIIVDFRAFDLNIRRTADVDSAAIHSVVFRNITFFQKNFTTLDIQTTAIRRFAAGDSAVLDGYVYIFARNGDNRCRAITRQRKPAEVERQRLVDGDIFRNITEQNDGVVLLCISNRVSNSRIRFLADLCSAFRCFRFCRSLRFCRVLRFCRSLRCGCAAFCSGVLTCRFYVLRRLTFRLKRFGVCALRRLIFRLKRFGVCILRRLIFRLRHRGICVRFIWWQTEPAPALSFLSAPLYPLQMRTETSSASWMPPECWLRIDYFFLFSS